MKLLTLAISFFSVLILSSSMSLTRTEAAVGSEAPDFTVYNETTSVRPADLKGKDVIVNFWSAKDALSRERNVRLSHEADAQGKQYIGICVDEDRELAREILTQDGVSTDNQYMSSDVKNGDPVKHYQVHSGLRAFAINRFGNIEKII